MAAASSPIVPHPPSSSLIDAAEALLRTHWGHPHLRPPQRRALLAALTGRDCLALLPTGGGKSLCFQLPALLLDGLTLVVSPLISLMQDQVNALRTRGMAAAYLSSTQRPELRRAVTDAVNAGRIRLLYVAPERLPAIARRRWPVRFLAVDEAHCISEWGHEFRPHFRAIGRHRLALGRPPTMAVTATATPATRQDILRVLGLRRPVIITQSFDRPNLSFAVQPCRDDPERFTRARARLKALNAGSAIVYVPTRNRTDGLAQALRWHGVPAAPYHAGLPGRARKALLARFLDGRIRVITATNAFGMGIDKSDVRLVLHLGIPARPEAYWQEAGRAGRDGQPAVCELFWTRRDLGLMYRLAGRGEAATMGVKTMKRYVAARRCRRATLLQFLGEETVTCRGCDICGT